MKYLKFSTLLFTIALTTSCKKDPKPLQNPEPGPVVYPNYSQLQISNYWVYQWFDVDSAGNAKATHYFDSSYIQKDTLIRDQTYFKLKTEGFNVIDSVKFLRDSLHYIVDEKGNKLFSSADFSNIIRTYFVEASRGDTICKVDIKMNAQKELTNVPAGIFNTHAAISTYYFYPNWPSTANPRYSYTKYAEKVGMVSEALL
ncbi:MAG: hypothetical protein ACXWDO_03935, partial [Bacteroidia bacterium]